MRRTLTESARQQSADIVHTSQLHLHSFILFPFILFGCSVRLCDSRNDDKSTTTAGISSRWRVNDCCNGHPSNLQQCTEALIDFHSQCCNVAWPIAKLCNYPSQLLCNQVPSSEVYKLVSTVNLSIILELHAASYHISTAPLSRQSRQQCPRSHAQIDFFWLRKRLCISLPANATTHVRCSSL